MEHDEGDRRSVARGDVQRREHPRRRCLLTGLLARPGSDHIQRVGLRNLSDTGAKLTLDGLGVVHPATVLLIPKTGEAHEIEVVWRELPEVGVRFVRRIPLEAEPQLQRLLRLAA